MTRSLSRLAVLVAVFVPVVSMAQNPPPPGQARGPQAPAMRLTSTAFADSTIVPAKYTCLAQPAPGVSPSLEWTNVPANAASLVLVVHDLERQRNNPGFDDFLHWIIWNIPPASKGLPEAVPAMAELPDGSRQMLFQGRGGGAPSGFRNLCTPPNDPLHHFVFELFALDYKPELAASATRSDVQRAIDGHLVGHAVLVGLFKR